MRVLVACEFSGIVRSAFRAKGHDAWSCDLLPAEDKGEHIQGDVFEHLCEGWDLLIGHPPCRYLANSGVRWLKTSPERWKQLDDAARDFKLLLQADIARIALENPIPHKYALARIRRKYDQIIQPWMVGHGETKATCLWLNNLPKLEPTNIVEGRTPRVHHASPGPDRWKERSRTLLGIAEAMADQWA